MRREDFDDGARLHVMCGSEVGRRWRLRLLLGCLALLVISLPAPGVAVAAELPASWRAPGSPPLSDDAATALVTPEAETRPGNVAANNYLPTESELSNFHNAVFGGGPNAGMRLDDYNPLVSNVTGGFTGTTGEIIQWAAHKWGIPADVLGAVAVNESYWIQGQVGDRRDGVDASLYPPQSRIDANSAYQSLGIMQIRWRPDNSLNPGTEPLRWKSTAFNVDYAAASIRYYFDGYCGSCSVGYLPGQTWLSVGAYHDARPWANLEMLDYIAGVQQITAERTWEHPAFVSWREAGSPPLSDAEAATFVTPRPENRPANTAENNYLPSPAELSAFHNAVFGAGPNAGDRLDAHNPLVRLVTGGFTGTTDEILQWAAYKWGVPAGVLRAVAVRESSWDQDGLGDRRDGVNASLYPPQARIDADSAYESMGITQIKWRPDGSLNPGTEPLRWKSTAFNLDLWGAAIRYYLDGLCSWCGPGYSPGQEWQSIGAHFSPTPWRNSGAQAYAARVRQILDGRPWDQPGF